MVQRAVRAVDVVVLDVLGEDSLEVMAAEDDHPIEALAPDGADDALTASVRGARTGVVMTLVPTAPNAAVNVVSRSRMRNLIAVARSASPIEMLRACWVTQLATGFEVMPAIRTKRLSWWMKRMSRPAWNFGGGHRQLSYAASSSFVA